jgi:hypothetical protein
MCNLHFLDQKTGCRNELPVVLRRFIVRNMIIAVAALALAAPAYASAPNRQTDSFSHNGVTYRYTTSQEGAATIIKGYADAGDAFRFVKINDHVTGTVNGRRVAFRASEAREMKGTITLRLAAL